MCCWCPQLLGELLLDRSNVKVMVRFVGEVQHLMLMMMLLKDQSRSIQFEAFHVFKVWGGGVGLQELLPAVVSGPGQRRKEGMNSKAG